MQTVRYARTLARRIYRSAPESFATATAFNPIGPHYTSSVVMRNGVVCKR